MHLYIMTRGIMDQTQNLMNDLAAQYFPYSMDGKDYLVQLAVRPIQLWELVMPKEALPEVQKLLWDKNENMIDPNFKTKLDIVRRMLGVQKVPKFDEKLKLTGPRMLRSPNVGRYAIGIKEDSYNPVRKKENL